jgi:hypothetical protein
VLDFQVPPHLQNISVTLECEVYNITQGSMQKFTAQRNFNVQNHSYSFNQCEIYMKREDGKYALYVLGKNGEPRPEVGVDV